MARIFYLSSATIPGRLAHTVQIMNMCAAMAELGHEVTLFCRKPPAATQTPFEYYGHEETFRVVQIGGPRIRFIGGLIYYWKMARAAARMPPPDILYGRNPNAFLLMEGYRALRINEAHDMPPNAVTRYSAMRLYRHPSFRLQVAVNKALREDLLAMFPALGEDRCMVARNGCRLPAGDITPAILPGHPDAPKAGYIGHLYPGKGMEVIAELPALLPEVDFHIVGGREEDIEHWRQRLQMPNIFFHGHVPASQVPCFLESFDIALAPLQRRIFHFRPGQDFGRYTSPLKLLEYMAAGVPIVASDIEPVREILSDGETGLLADPEDPADWSEVIRKMLADAEHAKHMAETAREAVLKEHSWVQRARRILDRATASE